MGPNPPIDIYSRSLGIMKGSCAPIVLDFSKFISSKFVALSSRKMDGRERDLDIVLDLVVDFSIYISVEESNYM